MDEGKLYWTAVVAVVSGIWVLTTFFRDRASQKLQRSSALISRLMDNDWVKIEHPDIQKYLSLNVARDEDYFVDPSLLSDDLFYKVKTYVYKQLNFFDEILSESAETRGRWGFLKPPAVLEISDWEAYIKVKLKHPLYRSILNREGHIFGGALRDFWKENRKAIEAESADPFIW